MCMMIQIRGFSPSPEGFLVGKKPSGFGQQHEIYIFIIEWILTRIHKAAQLRGLFRIAGCRLSSAIVL